MGAVPTSCPASFVWDIATAAYQIEGAAEHVAAAGHALSAGVPLTAYFAWSLLDNFEWAQGFGNRFGLVHVDYASQRCVLKDSGRWYRSPIRIAV